MASTTAASRMNRRQFLLAAAGCYVTRLTGLAPASGAESPPKTRVGLATDVWGIHQRAQVARGEKGDLADPIAFLERCHAFDAAGMQGPLGIRDADYLARLRRWLENHAMFIEASIDLAGERLDLERVEKQFVTAREAGATVIRVVTIPGRRYEYFRTADEFARASDHAMETMRRVEPMAARHRMRVAVENHKDHRVPERLDMLKKLSSEYVGVCVDLGNSFSLCEDATEAVRAYAPWAFTVHLKDQTVREYEDGFLFGDAALGEGFLDLPAMVRILRQAKPDVRFSLEVITRDALRVPVLTEKYWVTMGGVAATDLSRTLRTVKANASPGPLPAVSSLSVEKQIECEARNIERSLAYARDHLQL
jgi:sugar phosphate isomerase/epimerase